MTTQAVAHDDPAISRGASAESDAWARWWARFEPALHAQGGPDLTAMRGMVLGLLAGFGLSRLIAGVPERSMTRRVYDVVMVLDRLRDAGRDRVVADLGGLALRRLGADEALAANPDDWAWDAATDLVALYESACATVGQVPARLPQALRPPVRYAVASLAVAA